MVEDRRVLIGRALRMSEDLVMAARLLRPGGRGDALKRTAEGVRSVLRRVSDGTRDWDGPATAGDEDDMERRTFTKILGAAAAVAPGLAVERLTGPRQVDASLLDAAEDVTSVYASHYYEAAPGDLLGLVRPHLNRLQALATAPTLPTWRRRLSTLLSDAAAFAGWLSLDAAQLADARSYFALAREAAREAGDATLHALAVASVGLLHTNLPGADPGVALWMLRQADAQLPGSAPSEARVWMRVHLAKEHAAAGDACGYRRYSDAADAAGGGVSRAGFFSPGGWFADVVGGDWRWDCDTRALAHLAHTDAERALRHALASGGDPRRQATLSTTLSGVLVRRREPEEAARAALTALAAARGLPLWIQRVRVLRAQLDPWADLPAVRDLDDALAS